MTQWEINAHTVEDVYGGYVDWDGDERFYECPECGELIFEYEWTARGLKKFICPVCEMRHEEE